MKLDSIAILMPGDMGHAVGRALISHGHTVTTCLQGRSQHTRMLSDRGGLTDVSSLSEIVQQGELILSILPPAAALGQAEQVAAEMAATGCSPVYVDCNAISPNTAKQIGDVIEAAGGRFIDAGIIGLAPGIGSGPRIYVSGADTKPMLALHGKGFEVIDIGLEAGRASSLKMAYAGLTKGTWTLHTAVLLAAKQLGIADELLAEFEFSQKAALGAMQSRVPFLAADSGRWIGEMEEIAATFADAGVTPGFHEGAAEVFRTLARSPLAEETRQTTNRDRSLEEALDVFAGCLDTPEKP